MTEFTKTPVLSQLSVGGVTYYLKDADARAAIQALETSIGNINQFTYEIVDELPAASADTMYKIYLTASEIEGNVYDEYITVEKDGVYTFEKIGNTALDLSAYAKTDDLGALALKDSATGTVAVKEVTSVDTHTFTPEGSVAVTLKDEAATVDLAEGATSVTYQPKGEVTISSISVTPATTTIKGVTDAGTLPTKEADTFTAGSLPTKAADTFTAGSVETSAATTGDFATEGVVATVEGEVLTFSAATTSKAATEGIKSVTYTEPTFTEGEFNQGVLPSFTEGTFSQGKLPTITADTTVVTGITNASAEGVTFEGTQETVTGTTTGKVTYNKSVVDTTAFTGTEATLDHTVNTTDAQKTVTVQ